MPDDGTPGRGLRRPRRGRRAGHAAVTALLAFALSGCAARRIALPTDPGAPLPDFAAVHAALSSGCSGLRTVTAELSMSGRAGDQRLRGRVHAGFQRPGAMRLEGVAPFGPPAFILVARGDQATLLLPRDERVVRGPTEEILGAITGVTLGPADLMALLTGCVEPSPQVTGGRLHENGWASLDLAGGGTVYARRQGQMWQLRAARRGEWQVEYVMGTGTLPESVSLHADMPVRVDVTASIAQVEANVDLADAAFEVTIPPAAQPMSLEVLKANGPLRDTP